MKKIVHKYTKTENLVQIMSKIEKKIASQAYTGGGPCEKSVIIPKDFENPSYRCLTFLT